jgi:hypothetical protein
MEDDVHELRSSPNIIRAIKSKRTIWAGYGALVGSVDLRIRFWWGDLKQRGLLEDPGIDGRIMLQ